MADWTATPSDGWFVRFEDGDKKRVLFFVQTDNDNIPYVVDEDWKPIAAHRYGKVIQLWHMADPV